MEGSNMAENITLTVSRYCPEEESEPTFQSYDVPYNKDWVILDALNYIKDRLDGSLTFRWSCRMGVCGSCGMMVNGTPKLTCAVPLSDYVSSGQIRIEPLQFFPVVRDLVIDLSSFLEKLSSVKPWIIRDDEKPSSEGEYLQTPAELDAYKQFSMCINCMLCYSACPVVGLEPEFTGPAVIALAQRYNLDSRDQGAAERMAVLNEHEGMWGCTFVGECTKVCPKNVDPAGAIQLYKMASATDWFKSMLLPWGSK
jgi:fumarate reductase iron-sulfur subunit